MIYMDGKGRIAKDILSIILKDRTPGQAYVEPFVGGCVIPWTKSPQEDGPRIDHKDFLEWCREMTGQGHKVFISEYNSPDDFKVVWESLVSSSLSAPADGGGFEAKY